jgi:hypothetical protein
MLSAMLLNDIEIAIIRTEQLRRTQRVYPLN